MVSGRKGVKVKSAARPERAVWSQKIPRQEV
jgi:hypothetical protein